MQKRIKNEWKSPPCDWLPLTLNVQACVLRVFIITAMDILLKKSAKATM